MKTIAFTRDVPASMADCELTHLAREPIDIATARAQHAAYEDALRMAGCAVERIAAMPEAPDSVFVEDTAVVLDEVAVITRPGAESRRREVESVAAALLPHRKLLRIEAPATIDGGDVLRVGRRLFVGLSTRTNAHAIHQLGAALGARGYEIVPVEVRGVLHLKSAVTQVGRSRLLVNREWIDVTPFLEYDLIDVDPDESSAANALLVRGSVLFPSEFPRTAERLERAGVRLMRVAASELAKAEGALTCCSLVFDV
jgi:dimethylargininase